MVIIIIKKYMTLVFIMINIATMDYIKKIFCMVAPTDQMVINVANNQIIEDYNMLLELTLFENNFSVEEIDLIFEEQLTNGRIENILQSFSDEKASLFIQILNSSMQHSPRHNKIKIVPCRLIT